MPRLRDVCCIWRNNESDIVFLHLSARHTLWRHLQGVVTPLLASMVEVMDRFANLELLSDGNLSCGLVELWLNILADSQILDLTASQKPRYRGSPVPTVPTMRSNPYPGLSLCVVSCSKTDQEVLVQHYFVLDGEEHHCAAPFSWLLKLHLECLWEESEFIPGLSCLEERF